METRHVKITNEDLNLTISNFIHYCLENVDPKATLHHWTTVINYCKLEAQSDRLNAGEE